MIGRVQKRVALCRRLGSGLGVGIVAGLGVSPAAGAITVYTDEGDFLAAAGGIVTLEDFNTATPAVLNAGVPTAAGSVIVEHVGSDGNTFIDDGAGANNIDGSTFLDIFVGPEFPGIFPAESVVITLPETVVAVGFDLADFFSSGSSFGADVFAGNELAFNTAAQGLAGTNGQVTPTFIGFVSDTGFDSITFSSDDGFGEAFGIDNLRYAVPAPGASALLGMMAVGALRRRR